MWIVDRWREFTNWLDKGGTPAWVIATIFGFMLFWPLGVLIAFNMFTRPKGDYSMNHRCRHKHRRSTGNTAFDQYRMETLKRLEDERQAFEEFLQRLRESRDREQFDSFMKEHKATTTA